MALCRNYASLARPDLDDDARVAMLDDSLRTGLEHGFHEVAARAYTNLGELCFRLHRLDELERCVADGLAFTRERGFSSHAHNLAVHGALLALRRGDWADGGGSGAAPGGRGSRARDAQRGGAVRQAAGPPLGRRATRRPAPRPRRFSTAPGTWRCGGARSPSSRWRARRSPSGRGSPTAATGWRTVVRAWRPHAARPTAGPGVGRGAALRAPGGLAGRRRPGRPGPWAAGLRGDWRAAADGWARLGDPYERALELAESGEVGPTVEALHTLDDLGAAAAARHVRRRLRTLGDDPRARAAARPPRGPTRPG